MSDASHVPEQGTGGTVPTGDWDWLGRMVIDAARGDQGMLDSVVAAVENKPELVTFVLAISYMAATDPGAQIRDEAAFARTADMIARVSFHPAVASRIRELLTRLEASALPASGADA
jgi:hypothetical protein